MNDGERWLVGVICFLFLFGSAADWYRKTRPVGALDRDVPSGLFTLSGEGDSAVACAGPVDLNRSGPDELVRLPGIGPVRAQSIVRWRDENGPFQSVDDLELVPGIGPATMERLRNDVMVRPDSVEGKRSQEIE